MKPVFKYSAALIFLVILFLGVSDRAFGEEILNQVARANDLYQNKQYRKAAELYENIINQGTRNGHLYYNLGNTYMRLGQKGKGILNYIRARSLIPRDKDLDANLRYAVQETTDRLALPSPSPLESVMFWLDDFNFAEHLRILLWLNLLFWCANLLWLLQRTATWDIIRKSLVVFLVIAAVSSVTKYVQEENKMTGVVLAQKADVKSAQGEGNVTLFELHEGAVVTVLQDTNGWLKIQVSGDKKGWVPKNQLGI